MKKGNRKENKLYQNASIVTGLSIAERALGFLYRIVLSRFIGSEGVGLYQVTISHFFLLHTIGAGGIPTTVSRLIARKNAEGNPSENSKTVGAGLSLSLFLTLPICLILTFFGQSFSSIFSDERVVDLLKILLLILPFSCLFEVIRASFWGEKQFLVPALLEMAEEIITVLAGTILLLTLSKQSDFTVFVGAKSATSALAIAYAFSFVCAILCFVCSKRKIANPRSQLMPLLASALPITAVRTGASLVNSAIAVLFPAALTRIGYTYAQAMQSYGVLTGMAMPVLFIPITLISGLSLVLMPELSGDFYAKNYPKLLLNIRRGMACAVLLSCALIPLLFTLGKDMGGLLYANPLSGKLISAGCFLLFPMSIAMISTSVLNSIGKEKYTFVFYFIGASGMILLMTMLAPVLKEYAYLAALFFNFTLTAVCNVLLLKRTLKALSPNDDCTILPKQITLSAAIGAGVLCALGTLAGGWFSTIFGTIVSPLATAGLLILCGAGWYFAFIFVPRKTKTKFCGKN